MTGLTTGPRQFNFQVPQATYSEGSATPNGWSRTVAGSVLYYESKLDLRAMNMSGGLGLDLLNVSMQEGGPWSAAAGGSLAQPNWVVVDLISSVRLSDDAIAEALADFRYLQFPGFINEVSDDTTTYNPSQIIWGLWRSFAINTQLETVYGRGAAVAYQSGNFGQGEIIVAPHCYYYKILKPYAGDSTLYVPPTIAVCHGVMVELTTGQEMAQMARLSQR